MSDEPEVPDGEIVLNDGDLNPPPRYRIELIPDVIVQQQFEQWDPEKKRMVVHARGTSRHFSIGHNFVVHIERGGKFQDPQDDNQKVAWILNATAFLTLSKGDVNPDRYSPEKGVIKISVPRYCEADEARMKVVLAVRDMVAKLCRTDQSK